MKDIKIARVATVPEAFVHIKPFIQLLKKKNVLVTLISSAGPYEKVLQDELQLCITPIEINREIRPIKDLKSLVSLIYFFRKNKFDIIHSSTPKAGLLTAIAGIFSPSSIRIHTFTGQRWAKSKGFMRHLLKFLDKLIIILNTQCYADSFSQIEYLKSEGVTNNREVKCLHKGSFGGIDCDRFNNEKFPHARQEIIDELGLDSDSVIVLYVGRLTKDKGVDDLVEAFISLQKLNIKIKLILIGSYEMHLDSLKIETLNEIENNTDIFNLGFKDHPEKYFSSADIFCIPSYREGFGTVVLEAAACGLASIGTKIPGLIDAIVDNETGILVEPHDTVKLSEAILDLVKDEKKRKKMGEKAKKRAITDFDAKLISELQWQEYQILLKRHS